MNDYENILLAEKETLQRELSNMQKEYNRKTYIASGLAALIIETNDKDLIHKAEKIAEEADNLS